MNGVGQALQCPLQYVLNGGSLATPPAQRPNLQDIATAGLLYGVIYYYRDQGKPLCILVLQSVRPVGNNPGNTTLECGSPAGLQILKELLAENEMAVDVWYLLGMCQHMGGDDESALATLEEGEALAARSDIPTTDPSAIAFAQLKVRSSGVSLPTAGCAC